MKKLKTLGKLCLTYLVLISPALLAADFKEETVSLSSASAVSTASKYAGRQIAVQCDGEVRYKVCATSACTAEGVADSTSSRLTNFDLPVDICVPANAGWVSLIRTGATTVTCYVYSVDPKTVCK